MSEQFYTSTLQKKRRQGQRLTTAQRIKAQAMFLAAYEQTANILAAAELAEIDRTLVYYWQEHDEQFGFAFNLADKAANARIEAEIRRRAMDGTAKPLVSGGRVVYDEYEDEQGKKHKERVMVREYSDLLLMFYAKRRMPEYRDKQQIDLNTSTTPQDVKALHETIVQALAAYPEAKVAVAQALMEKEQARGH